MTYGIIDRKSHKYFTFLSSIFHGIENAQKQYNWLITDSVCYPKDMAIEQMLDRQYVWISGEELSALVAKEDFQWIWGCLCGFEKGVSLEEALKYPLPSAEDYNGYYNNPVSTQHPLSTIEVVPCDSSWVILISKKKEILDSYLAHYPKAEDLSAFNMQ